jgi:hypothetical protein
MRRPRIRRPRIRRPHFRAGSFANVTAVTALVISLGGTSAYAATLITSKQIKNNTIKSIDVRDSGLTGADVANGTLTAADLAAGTVPAPYDGSSAYSTFHDAAVSIQNQVSGQDPAVLSLAVPAGSYVFSATTWLENGATPLLARCTLSAGGDSDLKRVWLENSATGAYAQSASLQAVHTFSTAGTATLACWSFGAAASAHDTKLTAIRVDHLTNTAG